MSFFLTNRRQDWREELQWLDLIDAFLGEGWQVGVMTGVREPRNFLGRIYNVVDHPAAQITQPPTFPRRRDKHHHAINQNT